VIRPFGAWAVHSVCRSRPSLARSQIRRQYHIASLATGVQGENENAIGLYRDVGFAVDREWRVYGTSTT
jgi:ribosomal protein S18 acetylase RimI-like enzyme